MAATPAGPRRTLDATPLELRSEVSYYGTGWVRTHEDNLDPDPGVNRLPRVLFDYAAAGWQTSKVPFVSGSEELGEAQRVRWGYYPDGLLREVRDAAGQVSVYGYDLHDNLTFAQEARGATRAEQAGDRHARLVSAEFDNLDRIATSRQRRGDEAVWSASVFGYDRSSNLARRVDDASQPVGGALDVSGRRVHTFSYDSAGWLDRHHDHGGEGWADDRLVSVGWLDNGLESRRTVWRRTGAGADEWADHQLTEWTYTPDGRLDTLLTCGVSESLIEPA